VRHPREGIPGGGVTAFVAGTSLRPGRAWSLRSGHAQTQ